MKKLKTSNLTHRHLFLSVALAATLALAACGGGGSGSSAVGVMPPAPAPAPAPPAPAPATNPDLVTLVTPPTYAAGTVEKGAWAVLNRERQACGFGLLQQDSRLDAASAAHAFYLAQNSIDKLVILIGHGEDPTYAYFTGNSILDRAERAGYPTSALGLYGGVSEILTNYYAVVPNGRAAPLVMNEPTGAAEMRGLVETVYHLSGVMNAGRAGGIGSANKTGPTNSKDFFQQQFRLVADFAFDSANPQRLGSSNVASWPCAGLTGVGGTFKPATESPNPFPEITDENVKYGTPIYFKADAGSTLVVSAATVTKVSDNSVLVLRQLGAANDPAKMIGANEVFLVPTTALAAASSYAVSATGTLNGTAFTKTFTFATAP